MSYQAVIRNSSNALVNNASVGVKMSILQSSSTGNAVYVETHNATTNDNGLVSLQIGNGSVVTGSMAAINWANGPYFIKTETDPTGGTNYSISGTSELLSVPYALASGQSMPAPGNAVGDMQYWNGTAWVFLSLGTSGQILKVENNMPQWTTPAQPALSTVNTDAVSAIQARSATVSGIVVSNGGELVISRGICYSTSANPTVSDNIITVGAGMGTFSDIIQNLLPNTVYYVRAFATTIAGTAYGNDVNFTTTNGIGSVTTTAVTENQQCYITCGGTVVSDGGDPLYAAGICFSTSNNPTISDNVQNAGDFNNIIVQFTSLQPNTLYYYRAFITNSTGTFYGAVMSVTSQNNTATVTTEPVTQIKTCSATLNMSFVEAIPNSVYNNGICYSTTPMPTVETAETINLAGTLSKDLSCLLPNTTYYVRSFVNNCYGYKYGNQISFTTTNSLISVTTNAPTTIKACTIEIPYNTVNVGDGSCVGNSNGIAFGTAPNPTEVSVGTNNSGYVLYGLTANTLYYFRGFTTKCDGSKVYGNQIQVTTLPKYTSIITNATTDITAGTAILNASIIGNGQDYTNFGICFGTAPNPTIAGTTIYNGITLSAFTFSRPIQGLTPNTTYYARVFVHDGGANCLGISYGNQISFTTTSGPLVVGQLYQGGIIVKLNTATSGIIAATTDQGTAAWGCEGTSVTGTLSTVGSGQANTNAILTACSTAGIAARVCDALVLNGKSDWYLPSEQEMLLINQLTYFSTNNNETLYSNTSNYWSSTQSSATQAKIISVDTSGNLNKSEAATRVRAVRSF
ncbi:MAG: hypothetical protein CFE24_02480 [Flavobacterium sp. BFFFF2]|nr:MAG: hypothetical protein CFE24_02480 [Flavobacterium sp. BFFFF2]